MVDMLIIGAGPAGLATAIEAQRAGMKPVVVDKGSVVECIRRFPSNLVWFSTPELLEIGGVPFVCASPRPTRTDTLRYYQRVARHHALDIRPFEAASTVERSEGRFLVRTERGSLYEARTVVVATGYFDNPNRLGVPGEDSPWVSHYYDEPYRWFDRDVTVVGGRNSAAEAALDLFRNGARVTLLHRGPKLSEGVKYWILPDIENRIRAGEIRAIFNARCEGFRKESVTVRTALGVSEVPSDFAYVLIGFHPDTAMLRRFGIEVDEETLAPRLDADTLESTVPGLFLAGAVVAGKETNTIFVENGRLHGSKIVPAALRYVRNP